MFGALAATYIVILTRQLASTETSAAIVFYYMALAVPVAGLGMMFFAKPHSFETLGIILIIGILGTIGLLLMTESLRFAPVSKLMPIEYFNLLLATTYGYLIWQDVPNAMFWPGALLVLLSGLYVVILREKQERHTNAD